MSLLPLPRLAKSPHTPPLFSGNKAGIDKALRKLELALLVEFFGQQLQNALEGAVSVPRLEAIVAGGPGRKVGGEPGPGSAGLEYPEDRFEDLAVGASGTAASLRAFRREDDQGLDACPLCVGALHEAVPIIVAITEYPYFLDKSYCLPKPFSTKTSRWTRLLESLTRPAETHDVLRPKVFLHQRRPDDVVSGVRTPEEFAQGHLEGMIYLDLMAYDFHETIARLELNRTYYLYRRSGNRSGQAARLLRERGLETCNSDGLEELARAGAEVER
jgi:rhodanese-related sulfurtransferase